MYNNINNTTTFTYQVTGDGSGKDLSHWVLGICSSHVNPTGTPNPNSLGTDPTTGLYGFKWDVAVNINQSKTFTITLPGNWGVEPLTVAVKAGLIIDFGTVDGPACTPNTSTGSLGDKVWNDTDNDGVQDAGEAGIANVTVKLYDCNNNLISTTTTNASGNYLFSNLAAGDYKVKFELPSGYVFSPKDQGGNDATDSDADLTTGYTTCITLASGQNNLTVDAGMYQPPVNNASLGDKVWNDTDNDGVQDAGEAGIANVTVQLYDCNNNLIATTTTNASGNYLFSNLAAGDYTVKFVPQLGYTISPKDQGGNDATDSDADPSTGKTTCITLASGENNMTVDAGMYQPPVGTSSLGDKVWEDTDQDGVQDPGESGIPGVTVQLYDCNNALLAFTTTDASGNYSFANLTAGDYYVKFIAPSGYAFSPKDQGSDDAADSDADPSTGKTACVTLGSNETNNTLDGGLYESGADLQVVKTADKTNFDCGDQVVYTITITNNGSANAGSVEVTDVLPTGLVHQSNSASQGSYNNTTGVWTVGSLADGASATLTITVTVDCNLFNTTAFDLGPAADFNFFVLEDAVHPSSDTQGKYAAGGNVTMSGYSVGDQLPVPSGTIPDVLIVGGNLTFTTGDVFGGNVVYGGSSNLPTNSVGVLHGTVRQESNVIDFAAAKIYLENLSTTLGAYTTNGNTTYEWGTLALNGTDPYLNVFSIPASQLNGSHTVEVNVPNGAVVLVNITGNNIVWDGGLFVNGTAIGNVLYNFVDATAIQIQGIDVRGSILAPRAHVNFVTGVQNGQLIAKSFSGQGQLNLAPFHGDIPNISIINQASVTGSDKSDPVSGNNSSSVTITRNTQTGGGGGTGGTGNWQLVGSLPAAQIIMAMDTDTQGNIYIAAITGYIYKSTDGGATWARVNPLMKSGAIWAMEIHPNGTIYVASQSGVWMSPDGNTWSQTALENIDVRSIVIDNSGNLYAGTWANGMFKSTNGGTTWNAANNGIASGSVVTSMTRTPSENIFTGTFGNGLYNTTDYAATWNQVPTANNYYWAMTSNSSGDVFAAAYGEGIYRSTDNGGTWVRTNFPGQHIYSLLTDADDNLYAASYAYGVYVSSDNGATWNNIGLSNQSVSTVFINTNAQGDYSGSRVVFAATKDGKIYKLIDGTTSAGFEESVPAQYELGQNYPNPFNPSTRINVSVPKDGMYEVSVFSITGELVTKLVEGQLNAGVHSLNFNASNLPSGIYIYRLSGENVNITKKMTLMK
ncbi:MAG: choice-of-anchor A family protein [Ignavibacteriaceae bacterium]|nr:choice-of-anchor A family protein [Ignavibacteriaceae bacterium]